MELELPESLYPEKVRHNISYKESIVVYLDILGFQSLINDTYSIQKRRQNKQAIYKIYSALQIIRSILEIDSQNNLNPNYFVMSFSDCIVISFPKARKNQLLDSLYLIQNLLINLNHKGIIIRGGIAKGLIYYNTESKMIFGPGLVEAYLLESSAAHYPRVILSHDIIDICKANTTDYDEDEIDLYLKDILTPDTDDMFYIDYFKPLAGDFDNIPYDYSSQLSKTKKIIISGMKNTRPGIKIKYLWMKKKYNGMLKRIQSDKYLESIKLYDNILAGKLKRLKPIDDQ